MNRVILLNDGSYQGTPLEHITACYLFSRVYFTPSNQTIVPEHPKNNINKKFGIKDFRQGDDYIINSKQCYACY